MELHFEKVDYLAEKSNAQSAEQRKKRQCSFAVEHALASTCWSAMVLSGAQRKRKRNT